VRHQQKPAPFFGTVLADGMDVAALAAGWGGAGSRPDGGAGGSASAEGAAAVGMAGLIPGSSPGTAMTVGVGACGDGPDAAEGESGDSPAVTVGRRASAGRGRDAGSTPAWTTSRLDQGPGWTLDVVRPRRVDAGAGEDNLRDNAGAAEFRAGERAGSKAASDAAPARPA